ncbi:hypothetical protein C8J57DRAFT_1233931 [Mycena rebaudengoi]|nr:hypothetical protein C8J57DRAFT_1233931 [Mycena rebaudengoi]
MSQTPPTQGYPQLSNDICPKCQSTNLTLPARCSGGRNPENEGRYYQYCPRNNFQADALCNGYIWCDAMQRMYQSPPQSPSQSTVPALSYSSAALNTPTPGSRKNRESCTNPTGCRQNRNGACIQTFCKGCCSASSTYCPAPRHNEPRYNVINSVTISPSASLVAPSPGSSSATPSPIPFILERAYARPIDPSYVAKMQSGALEINTSDRFQRESYRKAHANSVEARWWNQNDQPAEAFRCAVPLFPWFHPKDTAAIVAFAGLDRCQNYAYWTGTYWMRTDGAMQIKANSILFLRAHDVTFCLDGPVPKTSPQKRRLSSAADGNPSPTQIRHLTPIAPETETDTSSSSQDIIYLSDDEGTDQENGDPFLQDGQPAKSESLKNMSAYKSIPWPLKYTCDMDRGFRAMALTKGDRQAAWKEAFGLTKFPRATYYTHWRAWGELSSADLQPAVMAAYTVAGEWAPLIRANAKSKSTPPTSPIHPAPVQTPFTKDYLWSQTVNEDPKKSLRLENLKQLIRLALGLSSLPPPTPKNTTDAIDLALTYKLGVDWDFVTGTEIDKTRHLENRVREFIEEGRMSLPITTGTPDSPLTENDDLNKDKDNHGDVDKNADKGGEEDVETLRYQNGVRIEPEYDTESEDGFDLELKDPRIDTVLNDPKIIVVNHLPSGGGGGLASVYRINDGDVLDLVEHKINDSHPTTLNVRLAVDWSLFLDLPGFAMSHQFGPLLAHQGEASRGEYQVEGGSGYLLPVLGPSDALRIVVVIQGYYAEASKPPAPPEVNPAEETNKAITDWLTNTLGEDPIFKAIRDTPARCAQPISTLVQWVKKIKELEVGYPRIPDNCKNKDIVGKMIYKKHKYTFLGRGSSWWGHAIRCEDFLKAKRTRSGMSEYILKTRAIGIEKFAQELKTNF